MRNSAAMLLCAGAALFWEPATLAQQVTSVERLPAAAKAFDDGQSHEPLPCSVHIVKPELNFSFRFQTGYTFETSLDPYIAGEHRWYIVFRVTPESNPEAPVYFLDSLDLHPRHMDGLIGQDDGSFQTGEGRYQVKWALIDDLGRVCRQEWTIDSHLNLAERNEKVTMPVGAVGDFSSHSTKALMPVPKSRHVTILLNAGMPIIRRGSQPSNSWGMLLSLLESILEQMPEASFRVVVFDSEQQRELFRKDNFTVEDMNNVARLANARQHWTVDYRFLQDPAGEWHLLRDLENKELNTTSPADAVIFLGVPDGRFDKMPPEMPSPKTTPRVFYLKYGPTPPIPGSTTYAGNRIRAGEDGARIVPGAAEDSEAWRWTQNSLVPSGPSEKPDFIEQAVRHLRGKVFPISSPANFSKALAAIGR